jgi:hypothetical protein
MNETAPQENMADAARAAGASPEFCIAVLAEPFNGFLNGRIRRHYDHERDKIDADALPGSFGDFFMKLWNGHLGAAYAHADISNTNTLLAAFTDETLAEHIRRDLGWAEESIADHLEMSRDRKRRE